MGTAVPPVPYMEVEIAPQASVAATMPHCLVHATQCVQLHLLSAGVELASDLAGWFAAEEEVWAYAAQKGWLGADLQGLGLAWAEAGRPQVAASPVVPVPCVTPPRPSAVRVPSGVGELAPCLSRTPRRSLAEDDVEDHQKRKGSAAPGPQ